jgi:hypothetical protein
LELIQEVIDNIEEERPLGNVEKKIVLKLLYEELYRIRSDVESDYNV